MIVLEKQPSCIHCTKVAANVLYMIWFLYEFYTQQQQHEINVRSSEYVLMARKVYTEICSITAIRVESITYYCQQRTFKSDTLYGRHLK